MLEIWPAIENDRNNSVKNNVLAAVRKKCDVILPEIIAQTMLTLRISLDKYSSLIVKFWSRLETILTFPIMIPASDLEKSGALDLKKSPYTVSIDHSCAGTDTAM
jgi:hypothetical protein